VCLQCRYEAGNRMAEGTCLSFELRPLFFAVRISPEVKEFKKGRQVTWVGKKWGISARHTFYFKPGASGTKIESIEKFSGPMLFAARLAGIPGRLHKLTRQLLFAIKKTAETRCNENFSHKPLIRNPAGKTL
jgi:hypothetical protein